MNMDDLHNILTTRLGPIFGRHAAKRIARGLGVSVSAAKLYLAGDIPRSREDDLAWLLLCELDHQTAERLALARQLRTALGEGLRDDDQQPAPPCQLVAGRDPARVGEAS
jgi:hypothetical protein